LYHLKKFNRLFGYLFNRLLEVARN
jgi:hypothetical protein